MTDSRIADEQSQEQNRDTLSPVALSQSGHPSSGSIQIRICKVKLHVRLTVADGQLCELCSHEPDIAKHETRATDEAVTRTNDGERAADVAGVDGDVVERTAGIGDESGR